jgi:hypothetical protein
MSMRDLMDDDEYDAIAAELRARQRIPRTGQQIETPDGQIDTIGIIYEATKGERVIRTLGVGGRLPVELNVNDYVKSTKGIWRKR